MVRCLILSVLISSSAVGQSIVTSSGGGSIVLSSHVRQVAVAVKPASVNPGPSYADIDDLRMEIEFLKSSLAAATTAPAPAPAPVPVKPVTKTVTQKISVPMTYSEMVAAHNRLHGGGSWTWPGDLATHLRNTHGASTTKQVTQTAVVKVSPSKALAAPASSLYDGKPGSSHRNRESLIEHLMQSKAHVGKHDKASLMSLTDQQLSELHTEDHYALGQVTVSPVVRIQSSASGCPGGVCPINQVRQSGGRSRRSRR